MKEYQVVPFDLGLSGRDAMLACSGAVAQRLQTVINEMARQGWEYDGYEAIVTTVNRGCLTIFAGPRTVHSGVLVYSRQVTASGS